jgi:biopolymer transport protein ExbD
MACATLFVRHPSIPLDQPGPSHESGSHDPAVVSIILFADGRTKIDEDSLASDDAILEVARRRAGPDTRAVIKADASVSHGRVIHVLDLLKQAGLTKIAFGVTALPAPDGGQP